MLRARRSGIASVLRLAAWRLGDADKTIPACCAAMRFISEAAPAQLQQQTDQTHKAELQPYNPDEGPGSDSAIVHKFGADLLHDCVFNKVSGSAPATCACGSRIKTSGPSCIRRPAAETSAANRGCLKLFDIISDRAQHLTRRSETGWACGACCRRASCPWRYRQDCCLIGSL